MSRIVKVCVRDLTSHNGNSATLYAVWEINTYTVTISLAGAGLSSSAPSISVDYSSSNTAVITASYAAAAEYYISAASCTNGYTVSVATGTSATGAKTATIYNNSNTATSTCTFTGVKRAFPCSSTGTGGVFTYGGVQYRKLADGNCYTRYSQGSATFTNTASLCTGKGSVPSAAQFDTLLSKYGGSPDTANRGSPYGYYAGSAALYNATGWGGRLWSSTSYSSTIGWNLGIYYTTSLAYAYVGNHFNKTDSYNVVCIRSS